MHDFFTVAPSSDHPLIHQMNFSRGCVCIRICTIYSFQLIYDGVRLTLRREWNRFRQYYKLRYSRKRVSSICSESSARIQSRRRAKSQETRHQEYREGKTGKSTEAALQEQEWRQRIN